MSFDTDKELRLLQCKAAELAAKEHLPAELRDVLGHVYKTWLEARGDVKVSAPEESGLNGLDLRVQGAPMLPRERFPVDADLARSLMGAHLEFLIGRTGPLGQAAAVVKSAFDEGGLDLDALIGALLRDDQEPFQAFAERTPEAPMTLRFLVQASVMPSVETVSLALAALLDKDMNWPHGHCPVCGSLPFMSQLREKEGYRFLSCSFCHADWRAPRVACAFCGERDNDKLLFYAAPDEKGYRIDVCKSCKRYLKTADFRELDRTSLPLLDDLESLSLDLLARKEGFARPTSSGFGI